MSTLIKIIKHNSKEYNSAINLRRKILRKPLNLDFSLKELNEESSQIHFAYFFNNQIIGSLTLVPKTKNSVKMRQVCVENKFQKKGIGIELVQFSEKWANENNYKTIFCHARKNALKFYFNMDYSLVGNEFIEVGLEHFKLSKKL